jgi:UDP-N-acetylmuramoylalanine--D-glutamate ligase
MSLNWESKKVLILGAGVTGNAVAKSLSSFGAIVGIVDENAHAQSDFPILNPGEIDITEYASVVVSPGWKSDHPLILKAIDNGVEIDNEIDIAWRLAKEISPNQKWLALTGTNGKTTTVEMTAAMLQHAGLNAVACGNVGDTVIDAVMHKDSFDFLILELSSFQLHWMREARFVSAAILNIADDHLDWHGSFENYCDAKFSILDRAEHAILNAEDAEIVHRANNYQGPKTFFSLGTPAPGELGVVEDLLVDRAFVGDPMEASMIAMLKDIQPTLPHSVLNALAAAALARSVNVSYADIQGALINFHPGRHRIETVLSSHGISWIDDSKATNPHAASASLMSHLSVVWVAGGLAKGADMNSLIERTHGRIKAAILIGQDRELIASALMRIAPLIPVIKVDVDDASENGSSSLMEKVVKAAQEIAATGDTVLLAPACASMDQFSSYADRGDRFAAAVRKMVIDEE